MEYQTHSTLCSPTITPELTPIIPSTERPSLPLDLMGDLGNYMAFQDLHQSTGMLSSRSTASPTTSFIDDSQGRVIDSSMNSSPTTDTDTGEPKNTKRRIQNREAQRRFRERKEQQKKLLHRKAEDLRNEYQILLKQYTQTVSDITRLVKENDMLRFEVKNLRQQWRLVFAVLQRLQDPQSPVTLPEGAYAFNDVLGSLEESASGYIPNLSRCLGKYSVHDFNQGVPGVGYHN